MMPEGGAFAPPSVNPTNRGYEYMETREFTAKSVTEAIEQAVLLFGVPQDDLEVEVLSEGRSGMFGIGGEEARIRVVIPNDEEYEDITDDEVTETLEEIVVNLLELM